MIREQGNLSHSMLQKGLHHDMLQLRELAWEHAAYIVKLFEFLAECSPQDYPAIQCLPA